MTTIKIFRPQESLLVLLQASSAIGFIWALFYSQDIYLWLVSLFLFSCITCLGITVTFHRLLAHKSYKLWAPLEYLFSFFGNMGCTGSSIGWVYIHRKHHVYSDKEGDPHSPRILGALGAIKGDYKMETSELWRVRDIAQDPVHRFYHDYHMLIFAVLMTGLYLISVEALVHFFFIPVFLNVVVSRLTNWIDHNPGFGLAPRQQDNDSRNVWWWSLFSFGEGWHNNHHAEPWNYKMGIKPHQFDPGKYVIEFLMLLKLAEVKIQI